MADALNQPMGFLDTLSDQFIGGALNSPLLGTAIRETMLPEALPEQGFWTQSPLLGPVDHPERAFIPSENERIRNLKPMTEEEYKTSPYFRKGLPYDPRFTADRAAALATAYDARKVREYFASKRPYTAFVGSLGGQAVDPINYIPVAGPLVKGAAIARFGRLGGEIAAASADAVSNTALGQIAAYQSRRSFGDDITWQSTVSELAMAGLIGAAFGGLHGAVNLYREGKTAATLAERQRLATEQLSTLENTQNARIALNDAIDRVVNGEDVELSPNSIDNIKAVANYPALQELSEGADTISGAQIDRLAGSQELPQKVGKPQSLLNFLASEGGIKDDGGELATLGLSKKFLPGRGALVRKNGLSLDYAREAAAQAGYLDGIYGNPETAVEKSTIADFLNLLDQEHRGDPVFASRDAAQIQSAKDYEDAIRNREDFKKLISDFSDEINKQKIGVSLPDELVSRAVEIHHEEGVSALSALDRAILEDEAKFYASMEEKGLASNDDPRYADIPFFDEPAANAAAKGRALGGKEQTGPSGRIGTNGANGRSTASTRLDTSKATVDTPPIGIKEAAARVGKPEDLKALAEQFGVNPQDGSFVEQADVDQVRQEGRLTEEDEADLEEADTTFENSVAFGEALRAAVACLL